MHQVLWYFLFIVIVLSIATFSASFSYYVMASKVASSHDMGEEEKEDYNHLKNVKLVGNENFGTDAMKQAPFMNKYAVDPFSKEEVTENETSSN